MTEISRLLDKGGMGVNRAGHVGHCALVQATYQCYQKSSAFLHALPCYHLNLIPTEVHPAIIHKDKRVGQTDLERRLEEEDTPKYATASQLTRLQLMTASIRSRNPSRG